MQVKLITKSVTLLFVIFSKSLRRIEGRRYNMRAFPKMILVSIPWQRLLNSCYARGGDNREDSGSASSLKGIEETTELCQVQ